MAKNILSRFKPAVAGWFEDVFTEPTQVQEKSWDAISQGSHALLVAPTGSGKTLAAFLWALNNLMEREGQTSLPVAKREDSTDASSHGGVKVLYISPLKALGVDIERNLRVPLAGISRVAQRLGVDEPDISIGVRSGDTPQSERNRQLRKPPDVLITTPESAYLMLTSKAAGILASVDTVIIDEIHAILKLQTWRSHGVDHGTPSEGRRGVPAHWAIGDGAPAGNRGELPGWWTAGGNHRSASEEEVAARYPRARRRHE